MTLYEFDSCVLDIATQQLHRDGELVHVEPQVLRVLEHLAVNADRVVTKMELLDEVWGDRFVSEAALTSRVKLARKACGDSGREQRIIKTIHGRGYRFVADVVVGSGTAKSAGTRTGDQRSTGSAVVGRDTELEALDQAVADTSEGRARVVFLTGETGSGKSTLVAEMLERNDGLDGWFVARGQCIQTRGGVEPYFCLLDALGDLGHNEPDALIEVLDRAAPSWLAQMPSLVDDEMAQRLERRLLGSSPQRMLREGVEAIQTLAKRKPLLMILEDLHWVDDCSLDVIQLLIGRSGLGGILLVATSRLDEPVVEGAIASAVAGGTATEIRLGPLGADAIEALLTARFDGAHVPEELVEAMIDRCDGVPILAQEILGAWIGAGMVDHEGDRVVVHGSRDQLSATLPASLAAIIENELARLDEEEISVLESAAAVGETFDGASVAAGLAQPTADIEATLGSMARRLSHIEASGGVSWPDGTVSTGYAFSHGLHRQVIYDRTPAGRRALLHARIGSALAEAYGERADDLAVTLSEHFVAASDSPRAVHYLKLAGEQAAERDAHGHAAHFFETALALVDRIADPAEAERAELEVRVALGPTLVATRGWFDSSVADNYERALVLAGASPQGPESAAVRYGLATVTELRGEFERTEALLQPVLDSEASGALAMEAHELMACSTFHQGAFDTSIENAGMVLESWDEDAYSVLMSRIAEHPASSCNSWLSLSAWAVGRSDESLQRAERAVLLAERNQYALSTAVQQRAMFHQLRNEPIECIEWANRTRDVGREQDFPMRMIQGDIYKGWALGVTGSPDDGMELLDDGLARFREEGARLNEAYYMGLRADAQTHAGKHDEALRQLDAALDCMHTSTRSYFFESELHRLRARALLAVGGTDAVDGARLALDESVRITQRQGAVALELRTVADRVELEASHGDATEWLAALAPLAAIYEGQHPTPDTIRAHDLLARPRQS